MRQADSRTSETLAEIIDPDYQTPLPNCCRNNSPYSIFAKLAHEVGLFAILADAGPYTLFGVADDAMNATAREMSIVMDLQPPQTVFEIYNRIKMFFRLFKDPLRFQEAILKFHVIPRSIPNDEIRTTESTLLDGKLITLQGLNLLAAENLEQISIITTFPLASKTLLLNPIQASNGFIHSVDLIIFPDMSLFPSKDSTIPIPSTNPVTSAGPNTAPTVPSPPTTEDVTQLTPPASSPSPPPQAPIITPVVSPEPQNDNPACFPLSAEVTLHDGRHLPLASLVAGHRVMVTENTASQVYLFTHNKREGVYEFISISSNANHTIVLSKAHYLHVNGRLKTAAVVRRGDVLRTLDGPAVVTEVKLVRRVGLVAPHTMHGDIVVNRVVASTYTDALHPFIAHALLWPVRAVVQARLSVEPLGRLLYDTPMHVSKLLLMQQSYGYYKW